jgi:hypothetical protein
MSVGPVWLDQGMRCPRIQDQTWIGAMSKDLGHATYGVRSGRWHQGPRTPADGSTGNHSQSGLADGIKDQGPRPMGQQEITVKRDPLRINLSATTETPTPL